MAWSINMSPAIGSGSPIAQAVAAALALAGAAPLVSVTTSGATFDFYISPTGSDSNDGLTPATAWSWMSLANPALPLLTNATRQANQAKMAGKKIGVLPGTYNVATLAGGQYNNTATGQGFSTPLFIAPSGTATAQTVLQSTTLLGAVLNAGGTDTNNPGQNPFLGSKNQTGEQYQTIDGFEITNHNSQLISTGGSNGAGVTPTAKGIVVQNCYLHFVRNTGTSGGNTSGITVFASIGAIIQNNYITDIWNTGQNRQTGVEFWSSINGLIQYNTIILTAPTSGTFYAKNVNNSSHTFRYNYCDASGASSSQYGCGLDLTPGAPGVTIPQSFVYNNVFVGLAALQTPATGLIASNSTEPKFAYNNTCISTVNQQCQAEVFGAASTLTVYNNILQNIANPGSRGLVDYNFNEPTLSDYNLYSPFSLGLQTNGSDTAEPTLFTGLATWQSNLPAGCVGKDQHSITGTATFLGTASGKIATKYQLASGSAGKGVGSSNGTTSGTATDMGAWGGIGATDANGGVNAGVAIVQIGSNLSVAP